MITIHLEMNHNILNIITHKISHMRWQQKINQINREYRGIYEIHWINGRFIYLALNCDLYNEGYNYRSKFGQRHIYHRYKNGLNIVAFEGLPKNYW